MSVLVGSSRSDGAARTTNIAASVDELVQRWKLASGASTQLRKLAAELVNDPTAPTAIRSPDAVLRDHLADSLVALELDSVRDARTIADIGSGAGLPGLPLAISVPLSDFSLIESSARKCRFIERAATICGLSNVDVVHDRAEALGRPESFDVVTARALAPLAVVAEYAAPLLRVGGALIAWRGRREVEGEKVAATTALLVGLRVEATWHVQPYDGAHERHLHLLVKVKPTPPGFPRRPGMARKRPLTAT